MQNNTEQKQVFLREQIIDKNYDPEEFAEFLLTLRTDGGDLDKWTLSELVNAVKKFKESKIAEQRASIQKIQKLQFEEKKKQEESKNKKDKQEDEDFKKFPQLFYSKYNLYDQSFRKKIKCQKIQKYLARDVEKFQVVIDKPEIRKSGGIFGFGGVNKLWFYMRNNVANKEVARADEDFEWLRSSYLRLYPGKLIPPLQQIKQGAIQDKYARQIRCNMIKRFLQAVSKDPELFYSQLTITFLTMDAKNLQAFKKKISGINSIRVLSAMSTLSGFVQVQISPLNHKLLEAANIFSQKSSKIYTDLKTLSSLIAKNYEQLTHNIYKFGEGFAQLQEAYSRSIQMSPDLLNVKLSNTFINLNNSLIELGRSYNHQKLAMQRNFSYFFRFNKLQCQSVCNNLELRSKIQQQYLIFKSDLLKRKQQVYPNPLQWDLPSSFLATIKPKQLSKQQSMKLMLPKDTDKENRLKDWLSFINRRMQLSYQKLLDDLGDRYIETFKNLSTQFLTAHKTQQSVYQRMSTNISE